MKKLVFSAFCGVLLFTILLATACSNNVRNNVYEDEGIVYAVDPLDSMLTKIELRDSNLITIKGEENVIETDSSIIRYCPVKILNSRTTEVKNVVLKIEESKE